MAMLLCMAVLLLVASSSALLAQEVGPPKGTRVDRPAPKEGEGAGINEMVQRMQGKPVRAILVKKAEADGALRPLEGPSAESFVRTLQTRVGQPFEASKVTADCQNLWNERRIIVHVFAEEVDAEIVVTFLVEKEVEIYEGVDFVGLNSIDRQTVDSLIGLHADRQVTRTEAEAMRKVLIARYWRDGFASCSIELKDVPVPDAPATKPQTGQRPPPLRRLRFQIDEGQKVTIQSITFIGNVSFAADPIFGLFGSDSYLVRDSHIQSDPARGFVAGGAFSREVLEEDLDRLRLFYRSRGFLDATVDLGDVKFTPDRTAVDITLVVVEGPRYRIKSVHVEHVTKEKKPVTSPPLYPAKEIEAQLKVQPGEYYDHDRLQRDSLAISDFYGRRGHPPRGFPGMGSVPEAFEIFQPPRENYGVEPEVEITFQVFEGVPKKLRDVIIRGNRFTRDHVIRRRVRVMPGDRIDMVEVNRSLRSIEQTRFFQDAVTLQGPRLQLEPVPGSPDYVNLALDVEDGSTGELRWGIGVSTGQGIQGQVTFNKRNFDLWNPPSSWNPITALGEILDNKAFHGGGQNFGVLLAPGSQYSQFQVTYVEPDVFRQHIDTYELRLSTQRRIRRLTDGYTTDVLGLDVGLSRNFTDNFNAGFSVRQESVEVKDLAQDASSLAYDAEGQTELRGGRISARYRDYDDLVRPTSGFELGLSFEVLGGLLGGEESLTKITHTGQLYVALHENEMKHRTVLHLEHFFGYAKEFGDSNDVFITERFYMGGDNLRGFDYRRAGPSQFGRPIGGQARYTASAEIYFPLIATRLEGEVRDRELVRWLLFTDFGLLGLDIDDPTFGELRASSGIGIRIEIPYLEVPIQLDLGWPWSYEETDDRRQLFFSISR
jgi:outer membrane protein insertion porin family